MFMGLPWTAWALMVAATVPGLLLALAFFLTHRSGEDSKHQKG